MVRNQIVDAGAGGHVEVCESGAAGSSIVLISDPRVRDIVVRDCGEPLVDLRGALRVDERRSDAAGHYARIREGVRERLIQADRALPKGMHLLIIEAYRPPELQTSIFDGYRRELRRLTPGLSDAEAEVLASRYVAPLPVAPHVCGAAIDLTLVDAFGSELDLGCPEAATPEESDGACYTAAPNISTAAREHRTMLDQALSAAGMVNYPTEWWHWSYGDRYWAHAIGAGNAIYGHSCPDMQ